MWTTLLLARIDALETEVFRGFEKLNVEESSATFDETLRLIRDELPVRVLKPLVGDAEYARLIGLLADGSVPPGTGGSD